MVFYKKHLSKSTNSKKKYFDYRDNTASMFLFSNFRLVIVMYCNTVNFQLAKKNESKRRKEREREKTVIFPLKTNCT